MKRQKLAPDQGMGDLSTLLESWRITLRAQNKAPRTIDAYLEAGHGFDAFLRRLGMCAGSAPTARPTASRT
ncbi:MAG: hypothetical protein ACR2MO_04150 [Acidimicrobiales bacterium]